MPVMGPSNRQDDADRAFEEIAVLLRDKYGVCDIRKKESFGMFSENVNSAVSNFRDALRNVFMWDSYNGF